MSWLARRGGALALKLAWTTMPEAGEHAETDTGGIWKYLPSQWAPRRLLLRVLRLGLHPVHIPAY
jgi:hypothetical protein